MKKPLIRNAVWFLICLAAPHYASADLQVWTLTQTQRVLRSDPAGTSLPVNLSAARNEWESFQILVRSDADAKAIDIEPGDLTGPDEYEKARAKLAAMIVEVLKK